MKRKMIAALGCGLVCALLGLTPLASATDGVVLINQATAARNGGAVGAGCTAQSGYLITLCQPGSYKLSGNVTVSGTSAGSGIYIGADNVTLDLNGFTLSGSGGNGVDCNTHANVEISDGAVLGFATDIAGSNDQTTLNEPSGLIVRDLRLGFTSFGIDAPYDNAALVQGCSFSSNTSAEGETGVNILGGSVLGNEMVLGPKATPVTSPGRLILFSRNTIVVNGAFSSYLGEWISTLNDNVCNFGRC